MAVLYNPTQRAGLVCDLLLEEKLVLVTSSPDGKMDPRQYVYVDWGPNFAANHQAAFSGIGNPPVAISLGPLALTYVLTVGGAGYFRAGTVAPFLKDGPLYRVANAPEFSHSAYAVYAAGYDGDTLSRARHGLGSLRRARNTPARFNRLRHASVKPAQTRRLGDAHSLHMRSGQIWSSGTL